MAKLRRLTAAGWDQGELSVRSSERCVAVFCVSIRLRSTSEIQHCHTSAVVSQGVSARERQLPAEEDAVKERGKPQP